MCGSLKSAANLSAADENLSFLLCALVSRNLAPGKVSEELDVEETTKFEAFIEVCRSEGDESIRPAPNPYALANKCGVSLVKLSKCSALCAALWTFYFSYFIKDLIADLNSKLKYDTLEGFLADYEHRFVDPMYYSMKEQLALCHMANLCGIIFKYISPKRGKLLVMTVAPRLVEGWNVKYICGSGQSRATADRVLIYEREGSVTPSRRLPRFEEGQNLAPTVFKKRKLADVVYESVETEVADDPVHIPSDLSDAYWNELNDFI